MYKCCKVACTSARPACQRTKIKADGTDQAVTGHPYYDTIAITVVNDHEIQDVRKKGGKVVSTATITVSSDGNTQTVNSVTAAPPNGGPPVTGKAPRFVQRRDRRDRMRYPVRG